MITGPESTGKSSLTKQLAKHFNTLFVPEYARIFVDKLENKDHSINQNDVLFIAKKQMEWEDDFLYVSKLLNHKFLICDTGLLVTKIWCDIAFQQCPKWIEKEWKKRREQYGLILLLNPDIPWIPDGQRAHPHQRQELFEKFKIELINFVPDRTHIITGNDYVQRVNDCIGLIEKKYTAGD